MNEKKYDPYTGYEIHEDQENEQGLNQDSIVIGNAKETYHKEETADGQSNGIALASMILGIIAVLLMLTCCCSPIAIVLGIAAIVCYAVSPKVSGVRDKKAKAGLICGIVSIIGTILLILLFIFNIFLNNDFQKSFEKEFNDSYEEQVEDYDDTF